MQTRLKLSSATLLAANLAPLVGVLIFGWSVSSVVILYWFENIVIGVINVARMLAFSPRGANRHREPAIARHGIKLILVPFFVFHYFCFCAGHGVFVFGLFPDEQGYFAEQTGIELIGTLFRAVEIFSTPLAFAAAALTLSHVVSFVVNYLGGREYAQLDLRKLMMMPYGRIVVLHLTIIFGGFVTMVLGEPIWLIVVLVLVKVGVDLKMHLKEHLGAGRAARSEIEQMSADSRNLVARGGPSG
jgi:hypothetical protein